MECNKIREIMKQLFIDGNATTLFFNKETGFDDIFEWIWQDVLLNSSNTFNLNEQHSCSVVKRLDGIWIKGDEDLKEITIEEITPIS